MNRNAIARAARRIADARLEGAPLEPLPEAERPQTEDEGYLVQRAVHRLLTEAGRGETAGFKVGATAKSMQEYLGLSGPGAGRMVANGVHVSGVALARGAFLSPAVECEIALTLGADLPPAKVPYRREGVAGAVAACHAAIEVVDNRYGDFARLGAPTLIADDMFNAACVLGRPVSPGPGLDLAAAKGALAIDGRRIGGGKGADLMGHPYEVLAWLANRLAGLGDGLKAGQVLMCGSVIPPVWLKDQPAGRLLVEVAFEGLGEVRVQFA
ncbi:MAG: fumarylacetoacetate hydrolase family protein [Proteobacteria bacterium]|nr:fumarylacetoacetate hydrolase family protein [Pseudomonadota bacterium]